MFMYKEMIKKICDELNIKCDFISKDYVCVLKKGNVIGQGIIHEYCITGNDNATGERKGGFGSTDGKIN